MRAAEIRAGHWQLFGWCDITISGCPRWHHDYRHQADAPASCDSSTLDHRNLSGGADARWIWEINRWAEPVVLAQNAWLNHELSDARLAQEWISNWCDKNPAGKGVNWCSALEAAIRLLNFCWVDALIRETCDRELIAAQNELATRVAPVHAIWVWRHRSIGSSANNHLIGELAALVMAARRWPSLSRLACCAERAWEQLLPEIEKQFARDGGNREQALHYHLFAWEFLLHASRAMRAADDNVASKLERMASFFLHVAHPAEGWDYGDSDDAQIVPLTSRRDDATGEWWRWLMGRDEEGALAFWLGEPTDFRGGLDPKGWRLFSDSGIAVRRDGGWMARVDGSPLGFGSMAAHGHLDAMHLSLWHGDEAVVIDPGTGAYYGDEKLRVRLASWEWHNGATPLRHRAQPRRVGPFLWTHHHDVPHLEIAGEECRVSFACDGPLVRRTVKPVQAAWEIHDEVVTPLPHVVTWRLSPAWRLLSQSEGGFRFRHANGKTARLRVASDHLDEAGAGMNVVSPRFGDTRQAPTVRLVFRHHLVSRWEMLEQDG
jgi:hypothetical protein